MEGLKQIQVVGDPRKPTGWLVIGLDDQGRLWHGEPSTSGLKFKWTRYEEE